MFLTFEQQRKLDAARAEGRRLSSKKYHEDNRDRNLELFAQRYREKFGYDLEAPKAKPWGLKKGKV